MPDCPNCGASNSPEDAFCRYCGAQLSASPSPQDPPPQQTYQQPDAQPYVECPNCGSANAPTSAHCVSCGAVLDLSKQQPYQQPGYVPPYQPPGPPSPPIRRGFRWWMLFAWPFMCLGALCRCDGNKNRSRSQCNDCADGCSGCADCLEGCGGCAEAFSGCAGGCSGC